MTNIIRIAMTIIPMMLDRLQGLYHMTSCCHKAAWGDVAYGAAAFGTTQHSIILWKTTSSRTDSPSLLASR